MQIVSVTEPELDPGSDQRRWVLFTRGRMTISASGPGGHSASGGHYMLNLIRITPVP